MEGPLVQIMFTLFWVLLVSVVLFIILGLPLFRAERVIKDLTAEMKRFRAFEKQAVELGHAHLEAGRVVFNTPS